MSNDENMQKVVLVTGASSGIGEATALALDKNGYKVFATVRKPSDGERLLKQAVSGLEIIVVDVTQYGEIDKTVALLNEKLKQKGLYALVNNAGIAEFNPIETLQMEKLRHVFEVNFFAAFNLTKLLIPLLRIAKGKIVNVSSVGGLTTIPFGFALCSSKHAIESLSAGLRIELKPFGINVIIINPSSIATRVAHQMKGMVEDVLKNFSPEQTQNYAQTLEAMATSMHEEEIHGVAPSTVADVILKAINAKNPKARYPVGPNAQAICLFSGLLPDRLFDKLKLKLVGIKMNN